VIKVRLEKKLVLILSLFFFFLLPSLFAEASQGHVRDACNHLIDDCSYSEGGGGPSSADISDVFIYLGPGGSSATLEFSTSTSAESEVTYRRIPPIGPDQVVTGPYARHHSLQLTGLQVPFSYQYRIRVSVEDNDTYYPSEVGWVTFSTTGAPTVDALGPYTFTDGDTGDQDGTVDGWYTFAIAGWISSGVDNYEWEDEGGVLLGAGTDNPYQPITVVLDVGNHTLTLRGYDNDLAMAAEDTTEVTIQEGEIPLPPFFTAPGYTNTTIVEEQSLTMIFLAQDTNTNDQVRLELIRNDAASWLTCDGSDNAWSLPGIPIIQRTCTGTPQVGDGGDNYVVKFRAHDLSGMNTDWTVTVTVQAAHTPPYFTAPVQPNQIFEIGENVSIAFVAHDNDPGDQVRLELIRNDAAPWLTCNGSDDTWGSPITRVCSGTPSSDTGSPFVLTLRAIDQSVGYAVDKTVTLTVLPLNNAPNFTSPTTTEYWIYSSPGDVYFTAVDDPGDLVKIRVIQKPDFIDCDGSDSAQGNPITRMCWGSFVNPATSEDIGTHLLLLRAEDNRNPPLARDIIVTLHVTRFSNASSYKLGTNTGKSLGADVLDYNEINPDWEERMVDGLAITRSLSASQGTRLYEYDPTTAKFNDISQALKEEGGGVGDYRSYDVNFSFKYPWEYFSEGSPSHLALSKWRIEYADSPCGPEWDYRQEAKFYRLKDTFGFPIRYEVHYGFGSPVRVNFFHSCWGTIDGSYASDIEYARFGPSQHRLFIANTAPGVLLPNGQWFPIFTPSEVMYWTDDEVFSGNIITFPGGNPYTSDFELFDADGDGDLDILAGGVAHYEGGSIVNDHGTALYRNSGDNSGNIINALPLLQGWNANWAHFEYLEQKATVADLNGDGKLDFVLTDLQHGPKVFRNTRSGNGDGIPMSFTVDPQTIVPGPPYLEAKEVLLGDINEDNKPDMILIGDGALREKVFLNTTNPWPTAGPISFSGDLTDENLRPEYDDSQTGILIDEDGPGWGRSPDLLILNDGQDQYWSNRE